MTRNYKIYDFAVCDDWVHSDGNTVTYDDVQFIKDFGAYKKEEIVGNLTICFDENDLRIETYDEDGAVIKCCKMQIIPKIKEPKEETK